MQGVYAQITQTMVPLGEAKEDELLKLFRVPLVPGLRQAAKRTDTGYDVEFAVPIDRLDETRGAPWDAVRLNVGVVDYDAEEPNHTELWWRADRFGGTAPIGSGTFDRR